MRFFQQLFFLSLLASWFPLTPGQEYPTTPTNIITNVKDFLISEGDKISAKNSSQATLIPNDDIISQIITFLNCGHFSLSPNSHLEYSLDYETRHLRSFQTCDRYFQTIQKPETLQVHCLHNKWVFNKIQCEKITCPRLTAPAGGRLSTTDNTYNTTVYFWCSLGFTINGTDRIFCEESGLWNLQPPTCHLSSCRSLSPPRHGFVSSQEDTDVNQTVLFSCESEYTIVGDAVLRCKKNGRWNTTAPVCKKMCTIPDFTNQLEDVRLIPSLNSLSTGFLVQQGQRVIFSCKPGYTAPSSGIATCVTGTWLPMIQCKTTCTPIQITNGSYVLSKDSSSIEYFCLPGYQLVGQQKLSCMPNRKWDGETPTCTKMCTLSRRFDVLTYRHRDTYETIPFGTQIVDETQVYAICRSSQSNLVKCVNGKVHPSFCSVRLENKDLEIYYNGE